MLLSVFLPPKKLLRKMKQSALFIANPWPKMSSLLLLSTLLSTLLCPSFYSPIMLSRVLTLSQTCRTPTTTLYYLINACFCLLLFKFLLTSPPQLYRFSFSPNILLSCLHYLLLPSLAVPAYGGISL